MSITYWRVQLPVDPDGPDFSWLYSGACEAKSSCLDPACCPRASALTQTPEMTG